MGNPVNDMPHQEDTNWTLMLQVAPVQSQLFTASTSWGKQEDFASGHPFAWKCFAWQLLCSIVVAKFMPHESAKWHDNCVVSATCSQRCGGL